MISSLNNTSFNIFNNLLILINKDFNTGSLFSNSCCVTMLAAALVLIFLSQTPVKASKSRPYCENTANKCCELHTSQCIAQNEKFDVINEKLEDLNEKFEDLNEKLEALIKKEQEQKYNCKLEHNGELKEAIMLTNTIAAVNISVWGSSKCTLRILAVGGGGSK